MLQVEENHFGEIWVPPVKGSVKTKMQKSLRFLNRAKIILFVVLLISISAVSIFAVSKNNASAAPGINETINFQGRLFNSQGAIVADGYYNVEFKIYQDGTGTVAGNPTGTLEWTESHLNASSNGVLVKNGYMSVELGSVTAFGTSVDWNQDTLWLSANIGDTNASCTPFSSCNPDGEMLPMKRLSSTPYSLNSGRLGGLASSSFVQISQGVQDDAANSTSSIFLNKTGTGGNFVQFQAAGVDALTIANNGDIAFGGNDDHTITVAAAPASTTGRNLSLSAGTGGSGTGSAGGDIVFQGGTGGGTNGAGGSVYLNGGNSTGSAAAGDILIGNNDAANTIQIGSTSLSSGTQTISIGAGNTAGGSTDVIIGNTSTASSGATTIQAKDSVSIATDGVTRVTLDDTNTIYLGNGVSAAAPNDFSISGTGSTTTGVSGGAITIQGGNATVGNANGGNLVLSGGSGTGTGVDGLVVLNTPTFSTTINDPNCYTSGSLVAASCTIAASSVNSSSSVIVGFNQDGQTASLPDPTQVTPGKIIYITAANNSNDFTLDVNGGGTGNSIAMRQNTTATMIWNGADWTAAGASSSTTLQSAYDNTLQSAGGAELIVSKTSNTNGLTIRDSTTDPVNGTLLSVQTSSAAGLLSVNSDVTEYASNGGAEQFDGSPTVFPASTWSAVTGATVSRHDTAGGYIATGKGSASVATTTSANSGVSNTLDTTLTANTNYNVSFTTRLLSGLFTDMNVYYSVDGTAASVPCTTSAVATTSVWAKVTCTFAAPASGITSSNAILIRQTASGTARTFYVDNLSVTIAANFNYATDGSVDDAINFSTNWSAVGGTTVTRTTSVGNDASSSAEVVAPASANTGVRNQLSVDPLADTLYRVTVYAAATAAGFDDFEVRYSRDGGTNFVDCADYNTQSIASSPTTFTKITCYITTDGTAPTNPYVYFIKGDSLARTYYVDTFAMTLSSSTTPNVQIGGGVAGGPVTLLTLDRGASAPIASDNDALLGSMYYDTTLGKLQCYEADGWGACGSSPDNVVTISPEYTNAVLHGTGIGTMISDICSDSLNINDGSSGQDTICGTNETFNYYKWTSPQATAQTYGIYVTYQLPSSFKTFLSGQTSIMGRTDSTNSTVEYQVYRNNPTSGLNTCGSSVSVSTGVASSWQTGTASGAADPSTCGFVAGDSIVFRINVTASSNANAYVGNLNFIFSNT